MAEPSPPATTILVSDPGAVESQRADEIERAVIAVLRSGRYILGPAVDALEQAFAARFGFHHAVGTANGTDALELCLRGLDLGSGTRVAVPAITAAATAAAVVRAGYEPVFIDIERESLNLDPRALASACTAAARGRPIGAVIPVHLYGRPCSMAEVMAVAHAHGLAVVEDCSHAHGATLDGRPVGTFGQVAAFSCYPTKNLGALGDAGLVGSLDDAIAARIRLLRQYGWRRRQISDEVGMNSRLDDIQAAILGVQLRHLDADNARRAHVANLYTRELAATAPAGIRLPEVVSGAVHHQYTIRCADDGRESRRPFRRDRLAEWLAGRRVQSAILYPCPLHLQPAYAPFHDESASPCPEAEAACREILCLPMHPALTETDAARVIEGVCSFAESGD